jgi:hypothetical protein
MANNEIATKQASWWVLIIVALILGLAFGYYLGTKGFGASLITNGNSDSPIELPEVE